MQIKTQSHDRLELEGRIADVHEYSKDKAANVTIAIDNGVDKDGAQREPSYIQLKSFTPKSYNALKKGMKIRTYGHVGTNKYTDKDGVERYNTDLIADYVEFLESKATGDAREPAKALG